jgi:pimeloyl-ACP methyl ester carboxylesterase
MLRKAKILKTAIAITACIVVVLFLAVCAVFRKDIGAARSQVRMIRRELFPSPLGDVEYRLDGDGPVVLISHGITGGIDHGMRLTNPDQWGAVCGPYRFLYVSRFGYLKSTLPADASSRLQARAYRDLLDHLGIDRVILFGNSGGGPSSLWFAVDYPERTRGLILHSSAVPGPVPAPIPRLIAGNDFFYWASVRLAPGMLLGLVLPGGIIETLTPIQKDSLIDTIFMASLPVSLRSKGISFDNRESIPSINEIPFESVKAPTLIVQSEDDPRELEGAREMSRRIPDCSLLTFGGGHFFIGHGKEIRGSVDRFISGLVSETR